MIKTFLLNCALFVWPHIFLWIFFRLVSWAHWIARTTFDFTLYFSVYGVMNVSFGALMLFVALIVKEQADHRVKPVIPLISGLLVPSQILVYQFTTFSLLRYQIIQDYYSRAIMPYTMTHYLIFLGIYSCLAVILFFKRKSTPLE